MINYHKKNDHSRHAGFHFSKLWVSIGYIAVCMVIYLSLAPQLSVINDLQYVDKLGHLAIYSILMCWFSLLYIKKKQQLLLAVGFCLMGISLEIIQDWGGQRHFEYTDMLANIGGVILGWWLSHTRCAGWLYRIDQALSR